MEAKKARVLIFLILFFLFSSVFGYCFFYLVKPVEAEINRVMDQLKLEDQLVTVLEQKVEEEEEAASVNMIELQSKVPVKPLLDQFVLDLKTVESLSQTHILNISVKVEEGTSVFATEEVETAATEVEGDEAVESEVAAASATTETEATEAGLQRIILDISLTSPSYDQVRIFVQEIENLQRIIKIDSFSFEQQEEEEENTYFITLSTFYTPQFRGVVEELPQVPFPLPSGKTNPLR